MKEFTFIVRLRSNCCFKLFYYDFLVIIYFCFSIFFVSFLRFPENPEFVRFLVRKFDLLHSLFCFSFVSFYFALYFPFSLTFWDGLLYGSLDGVDSQRVPARLSEMMMGCQRALVMAIEEESWAAVDICHSAADCPLLERFQKMASAGFVSERVWSRKKGR